MVVVVVEPTIVQGKVEDKSHLEAAKEATSQGIQNVVDKAGKQKKNKNKNKKHVADDEMLLLLLLQKLWFWN
jgi:arsenate reductase-like glutaredoxin family protein